MPPVTLHYVSLELDADDLDATVELFLEEPEGPAASTRGRKRKAAEPLCSLPACSLLLKQYSPKWRWVQPGTGSVLRQHSWPALLLLVARWLLLCCECAQGA